MVFSKGHSAGADICGYCIIRAVRMIGLSPLSVFVPGDQGTLQAQMSQVTSGKR